MAVESPHTNQSMERVPLFEEDKDYIEEEHIEAFAKALVWEEHDETLDREDVRIGSGRSAEENPSSRDTKEDAKIMGHTQTGAELDPVKRPDLITSKSDWYPMANCSGKKRRRSSTKGLKSKVSSKKTPNEFRSSFAYSLLRWPVLFFIISWVFFLCFWYVSVRTYVAMLEYLFTWVGQRKVLRDKLRSSKTYEEWIENAIELDKYLNLDKWSINPKFSYYDYRTVALTIKRLRKLKADSENDNDLMMFLQGCLKKNFAGIENRQLYSHKYYGTKNLVEEYVQLVTECIDKITDSPNISPEAKRKFFKIALKNYGKSALCLSGGACFAYTHFGIVKALLDHDLLPSIVSGTSGGGLVAALTCSRNDEDLRKLLVPQLARKITACEDPWYVWMPRWWKTGARFDAVEWAKKCSFFTKGSTTFEEAYKATGRKLNISTVPGDPHSPVILCNNITSPNCIIWSSLLASSAVPGILNPVVLMMKNPRNGQVIPFSLGSKWRDGSLRTDIPVEALNTYYNVNFSIVSQVNPHISLFFFAPKGTVGRPVASARRNTRKERFASLRGGFIATALEQLLKLEITKWLQIVKTLDLLPHFMEQDWLNIWLQRFSGSITIWPRIHLKDFWYILSDPTEEQLLQMILKGERSMFPRLLFIKHRLTIERAIERGRKASKLTNKILNVLSDGSEQTSNDFHVSAVDYDDENDAADEITSDDLGSDLSSEAEKQAFLKPQRNNQYFQVSEEDDEDDEEYIPSTGDDEIESSISDLSDIMEAQAAKKEKSK